MQNEDRKRGMELQASEGFSHQPTVRGMICCCFENRGIVFAGDRTADGCAQHSDPHGALSGDFCNDWLHVEPDEAEMCGDENDVHFMRRFKKNAGIIPTEYRTLHEIPQNEQQ